VKTSGEFCHLSEAWKNGNIKIITVVKDRNKSYNSTLGEKFEDKIEDDESTRKTLPTADEDDSPAVHGLA
jgi:hypothetical protein